MSKHSVYHADGATDIGVHLTAAMLKTSCPLVVTDLTLHGDPIVFVNPAFAELTGYEAHECIGRNCRFLQGPDTDRQIVEEIRDAITAGDPIRREILNYRKNGEAFWNDLRIDPIHSGAGRLVGFVGVLHQMTAQQIARAAQLEAELRLQAVVDRLPGYIFRRVLKPDGTIVTSHLGSALSGILGTPVGTATSADFHSHVHPDDQDRLVHAITLSATDLSPFNEEFRLISSTGELHWFHSAAPPRRTWNGDIVWEGFARDITSEKAANVQLAFLTFHDALTGLSNRARFESQLHTAVEAASLQQERLGVILVDLDAFQAINTSLGQSAGDDVLRAVGQRLEDLAGNANAIVARLGGDEFALLLPTIAPSHSILDIAASICRALARPMNIAGHAITLQACVGAAMFARDPAQSSAADPCGELMQQVDTALRAAKQNGPGTHRAYAAELEDRKRNQMVMRQSLHRAIEEEQFELHYQPLVNLCSGRIVGAEALVRWTHPSLGLQRPELFIPLAEETGLIVPLGVWIMEEAMRCGQEWRRAGIPTPRIAINVSSVQLQKPGFIASVEYALAKTGADPHDFEFELTEGLLIEASMQTSSILNAVKSMGFRIAIDDFGTGHSTFKYLRDFPADKIKIDQTFIRKLVTDSNDAIIVRAMVALAKNLGIEILAEGIENVLQRDFLRKEGCQTGQGYLFSMPLTAEDFGWMLQSGLALPMPADSALTSPTNQ